MTEQIVDIEKIVREKTGLDVNWHATDDVGGGCNVFRFGENDEVHMIVDGMAEYEIIVNPDTDNRQSFTGHLGE